VNAQRLDGFSALHFVSQNGYIDIVKILLDYGADIEIKNIEGCTPFWFAAAKGQTDVVRALLSAGADVNTQRIDGISAISFASQQGHIDVIKILIDNGAVIEKRDFRGSTPLSRAAVFGQTYTVPALVSDVANVYPQPSNSSFPGEERYINVAKTLLDKGANVENKDMDGCTPLLLAASMGGTGLVRELLRDGADVNAQRYNGASALGLACREGYIDTVNALLNHGAHIETRDNFGHTPLWIAAANGQTNVLSVLVSAGADVTTGATSLVIASRRGYVDIVRILLVNGIDIETADEKGFKPLWLAAASGQAHVVRELVSSGADVTDVNTQRINGLSALNLAIYGGFVDTVKILIDSGADVESRNKDGSTPLWFAAFHGQTDIVHALVSAGADVNTQRNDGFSALSVASHEGFIDIVNFLLENCTDIEIRDNEGRTPLYCAAVNGQTDVVRALVSAGADVNKQNNYGTSVLGLACQGGYIDIVNILLDKGAQVDTRDNSGRTPLWLSECSGHIEIIDLLIGRGADVDGLNYLAPYYDYSPVCVAAVSGHRNAVMTLIRHGANVRHEYEYSDPVGAAVSWCKKDAEEMLRLLIINGAYVYRVKHGGNQSALMMAAYIGRLDIVKALIDHGADVYVSNFDNIQPIDVAGYCGHGNIVQFLSSCDSSATVLNRSNLYPPTDVRVDCRCNTAMHLTTDLQTTISLLENGADVEADNVDGLRPIHCAVRTGIAELVELLIQHGANIDAADVFGNRPLHEAACHGLDVVHLLVQHGAKLNAQNNDGKTPLHMAIERQKSDVIMFLLSQDTDVGLTDLWRNTPLHYFTRELLAVSEVAKGVEKRLTKGRQRNVIRNIVDVSMSVAIATHGISGNHYQKEQYSVANNTTEIVPLSIKDTTQAYNANFVGSEGSNADCYGNTPLHYAVGVYGQLTMFRINTDVTETVDFLVKHGADINAQNKDGLTPLHVARGEKAIEACLLHANNNRFTVTDKRGRNFWHLLFITRTQNEVELGIIRPEIVSSDVAKYNVNDLNRTPLHYACMNRNPWLSEWDWLVTEFIKKFSEKHINKQDRFGRTALHYASMGGTKYRLKKKKTDNTIRDNYQKTSSDYERHRQYFSTQKHLLRLTKSSGFIASYHRDISACVLHCFADSSVTVHEPKAKM